MESTLVIKVKCGETLRRFITYIDEHDKLELNMEQLREKMCRLFNLAAEDDLTLTYTDTDGDAVTLVEDCDLDDVVSQRLNPVRMVLTLKTGDKSGSSNVRTSRNSTPMDSPRIQESIENIQTNVEKVVKTVPEPLRGVLLKLTRDLAATASAPLIADLIHSATKIGESFTCENSHSFARKESNAVNNASEGETSSGLPRSKSKIDAEVKVKVKAMDSGVCRVPDLNHAPPPPSGFASTMAASNGCSDNIGKEDTRGPRFANDESSNFDVKQYNGCPFMRKGVAKFHTSYKGDRSSPFKRSPSHFDSAGPVFHTGVQCDGCGVHPIAGPRFKSKVRLNYDLCSLCYKKLGIEAEADYDKIESPLLYHIMKTVQRRHGGHRNRFEANGQFKQVADPYPYVPFTVKPVSPVNQVKLDSRFILDVNVIDETVMAPLTRFTKIWRMQNNGNVVWPVGTQLVWIDGYKFSDALSVDLEIPAAGIPVESEIDVAVDFVAPDLPGEYVSYWRMASPSGQKFGQMVWVLIQVDASPNSLSGSFNQLNLNLPPRSNGINEPVVIDMNVEPSVVTRVEPVTDSSIVVDRIVKLVEEAVAGKGPVEEQHLNYESKGASSETVEAATNNQDLNFPINDFILVGHAHSNAAAQPATPTVGYPVVDSSKIDAEDLPVNASSKLESLAPPPQSKGFTDIEKLVLKNLSEMGFSQVEVNREILRKNGYDMEKTIVDLWDISEWDPIMDELEEMGFSDKKKNAILLVKNKGSIKRVVMDLLAGDKSQ